MEKVEFFSFPEQNVLSHFTFKYRHVEIGSSLAGNCWNCNIDIQSVDKQSNLVSLSENSYPEFLLLA